MGIYNAFYIRKKAPDDATRSAILSLYPNAQIESFADFIGGILSIDDLEPPEEKLSALSAELVTDIIWIGYSTVTESFLFHHWSGGSNLRILYYGCAEEGTWNRVEGQPEPWERDYFWDEESLECQLECAETDNERQKLRKLWKDGLIIKGATAPSAGSDTAAEVVMAYYKLFGEGEFQPSKPSGPIVTNKDRVGCLIFNAFLIAVIIVIAHGCSHRGT